MTTCQKCHGIHTLISPKFRPECGESLLELQTKPATDAEIKHAAQFSPGSVTPAAVKKSNESFTPAQMVAAIDQWLSFGERMLAANQQGGYFSGSGWAARALAAARDFIEKAGAE